MILIGTKQEKWAMVYACVHPQQGDMYVPQTCIGRAVHTIGKLSQRRSLLVPADPHPCVRQVVGDADKKARMVILSGRHELERP